MAVCRTTAALTLVRLRRGLLGGRQEGGVDQLPHHGFDTPLAKARGKRARHLVKGGSAVALGGADQQIGPGPVLVALGLP